MAEILVHSDTKMTLRYAHPTTDNMMRAVDLLCTIL